MQKVNVYFDPDAKEKNPPTHHQRRVMSQDFRNISKDTSQYVRERRHLESRVSMSFSAKECCICFDAKPDAVIMECGHGGICY